MDKEKEIKTQDFVADFYEKVRYEKEYSRKYHNFWFGKMVKMASPRGLVLDAGCGTGEMMEFLKENNFENFIGYDISFNMLVHAKKRAEKLVCADAENLPFADNSFDVIYARALLHHLFNVPKALSEIKRVLKPDGEVVFADTNKSFINDLPRKIMNKGEHFAESHRNFKSSEIIEFIKKDFEIKEVYYFGYIAYPLLGFPDMVNIYRFFPFKKILTPSLIFIDKIISQIPIVKKLAFGIMIGVRKR